MNWIANAAALLVLLASSLPAHAALVHYYPFDGDALDAQGGNDGTVVGGAAFAADPERGTVLTLDGVDGYVQLSGSTTPGGSTSTSTFSVAAWVLVNSISSVADTAIYSETNTTTSVRNTLSIQTATGKVQLVQFPPGGAGTFRSPGSVVDGSWHHVAYVQNEPGEDARKLYIDGKLVASDDAPQFYTGGGPTSFTIGGRLGGTNPVSPSLPSLIGGAIDDVRFYDTALDAAAVAKLAPEPSSLALCMLALAMGVGRLSAVRSPRF